MNIIFYIHYFLAKDFVCKSNRLFMFSLEMKHSNKCLTCDMDAIPTQN